MTVHQNGIDRQLDIGTFQLADTEPDVQAILWILHSLQVKAMASAHIQYGYGELINRVFGLPKVQTPPAT